MKKPHPTNHRWLLLPIMQTISGFFLPPPRQVEDGASSPCPEGCYRRSSSLTAAGMATCCSGRLHFTFARCSSS